MTTKKIIEYLENPPEKGMSSIGMLVDFKPEKLEEMLGELKNKDKLLERVITVCEQWNALRVCPRGGIGTIARYQMARLFLERTK